MDGNFFRSSVTPPPIPDFVFDLQRFDSTVTISSLESLSTYAKDGYYELTSGTYNIDDGTTNGSAIALDKPIVIPSGAAVTINLVKKVSGFKEASNFSGGDINSLIQIQGNGSLTITATANFSKSNAKIQSSTVDSAISIVAAEGVTYKATLIIDSAAPDSNKNSSTSTYYPAIIGKTYGIKADSAADIKIYGGDIHSTADGGAGILQADGTLEISRTKATIYGKNVGIQFDSTDTSEGGNLNITAGEIYANRTKLAEAGGTGILIDDDGVVANIGGAMTTSKGYMTTALEIKNLQSTEGGTTSFGTTSDTVSTVNISGGTVSTYRYTDNNNNTYYAIKNDSNVAVTISDGKFKGQLTGTNYDITGGTFQSNPGDNFEEIYLNSSTKSYVVKGTIPEGVVAKSVDSEGVTHYYTGFNMVSNYATAGDEITLIADTNEAGVTIKKNLTLNLNGHNITKSPMINASGLFIVDEGASFAIKDDSAGTKGTITDTTNTVTDSSYAVVVSKGSFTLSDVTINARKYGVSIVETENGETANSFTMESGAIDSADSGSAAVEISKGSSFTLNDGTITSKNLGVGVFGDNATFNMNGGSITADGFGISNNGTESEDYSGTIINISDGSVTSTGAPAIYNPAIDSTLTISGGTISGTTGVEIRAGELNVTGGTITGTGTAYTSTANGNGSTSSGAGIAISQHTTKKAVTVNISGYDTNISGANALAVANPQNNTSGGTTGEVTATIDGGTLTSTATASSSSSTNGNAVLVQNANVNLTVNDGTLDGNVTVTKDTEATAGTNDTSVEMKGGTTTGTLKVVETTTTDGTTTETEKAGDDSLEVTGGTYTDTESANKYVSEDVEVNENGSVVNKGAGWTARSGESNVYDYLIKSGGNDATLLAATLGTGINSVDGLKSDTAKYLLGIDSSATFAWNSADSVNYRLAKFTATDSAITLTPQTANFKIEDANFIGNVTALTSSLESGMAASIGGIYVDARDSSLSLNKMTGGAGNDTFLAGARTSTLDGGAGSDLLVGGTKADLFVYSAGNDTIDSLGTGDTVSLSGSQSFVTDVESLTAAGETFALHFDSSNTLTFKNAATAVNLTDGTDTYTYIKDAIMHDGVASLTAQANSFDATAYSTITTINGSAATNALAITGNSNGNYMLATNKNDTFVGGSGNDTFIYSGGDDVIQSYGTGDVVSISGDFTPPTNFDNAVYTGSNYIVSFGSASLTAEKANNLLIVKGNDTYHYTSNSIALDNQTAHGITLGAAYSSKNFNAASEDNAAYVSINAADVTHALRITGNDKNNYIVGGSGGGTLLGGAGADSLVATDSIGTFLNGESGNDLLIGGDGADTFAYTGGTDSIRSFDTGDLVSVRTSQDIDLKNSTFTSADNNNVTLSFGGDNKLVFEAVADDKAVSLRSGKNIYTLTEQSIALDKSITLTANFTADSFGGDAYNTVDASAVGKAISIVGNDSNNYIIGSASYANSLAGGKGNDTLRGGNEADVFFYTAGKDVIQGYGAGDSLSIDTSKIAKARVGSRKLTFTMTDKANTLVFRSDDSIPAQISLTSGGYLTQDGVVKDSKLDLFASAKGRIDYGDGVTSINASAVDKQSVTLVGGSQGGLFTFKSGNKKRDGFEYNGGAVSISGYEAGKDKINLGNDSISAFSINGGDVLLTLAGDAQNVISLQGAKGSEVLIHQSTNRGNSYSKMAFADTGVLYDKATAKATSATLWSNASNYTADGSIKKVTVGSGVHSISVTANDKANTMIDASAAGADLTLVGGAKNDKFTGSSNADTFVYSAGKDIIQSFGEADSISLGNNLTTAKISAGSRSIKFKFDSKNVLTVKAARGDKLSGTLTIDGKERIYGKNSIAEGSNVSLTSKFGGTYKVAGDINYVDGHLTDKKLTVKGTTEAETIVGGANKTLFKGAGGADSLVGGSGEDTFFYARGDASTVQIADFDFDKDKLKIASGTLSKVSSIQGGVQFAMKNGRGDSPAIGWFNVTSFAEYNKSGDKTQDTFDASKTLIKANGTYYWFADGNEILASSTDDSLQHAKVGDLITSASKINNSQIKGYDIIELNYSTNLIKSEVAVQVKDTLKAKS